LKDNSDYDHDARIIINGFSSICIICFLFVE